MRISSWTEYSLIIALHLARRMKDADEAAHVAACDLAEAEKLPSDFVEQILLRLRRAGVVKSVRGARGGYYLAKDPSDVTVYDVMTACDRQTFEVRCDTHPIHAERCAPGARCSIRPVWQALRHRIDDLLQKVTLADLLHDERQVRELVKVAAAS